MTLSLKRIKAKIYEHCMEDFEKLVYTVNKQLEDYKKEPTSTDGKEMAKEFYVNKNSIIRSALKTVRKIKMELNEDGLEKIMRSMGLLPPTALDCFISNYQTELAYGKGQYKEYRNSKE